MTRQIFEKYLLAKLISVYFHHKIKLTQIFRAEYEEKYSQSFYIPAVIDFTQPVLLIEIYPHRNPDSKENFIAFLNKKGQGCICPEDKQQQQRKTSITRFEFEP